MMRERRNLNSVSILLLAFLLNFLFIFCGKTLAQENDEVKKVLFKPLTEKLELAQKNRVPFYAPEHYKAALKSYKEAEKYYKDAKALSGIKEKIFRATELLDEAIETARISKVVLEKLVKAREQFLDMGYQSYLPHKFGMAERQFGKAVQKAEKGDIRSARSESEKVMEQYRAIVIEWLQDYYLKKIRTEFESRRRAMDRREYSRSQTELKKINKEIESYEEKKFDPFQFRKEMLAKIDDIAKILYPPFYKNLPDTLLIGDFTLLVEELTDIGSWSFKGNMALGVSGTAWTWFKCSSNLIPVIIKPGYMKKRKGILVSFEKVNIKPVRGRKRVGRIIQGSAVYPAKEKIPGMIKLPVNGFIAEISALTLTPSYAKARVNLLMPKNMAAIKNCRRAKLMLGETRITYNCEFYVENTAGSYGEWLIGNSGMVVHGRGFIADFSSSKGAPGHPLSWKGVLLKGGKGSAKKTTSDISNTGYLTAEYYFDTAAVTKPGFSSKLYQKNIHSFFPVNPLGYKITFQKAELNFLKSEIMSGKLGNGVIELPVTAICENNPGDIVKVNFSNFTVAADLDLSGELKFGPGSLISWGELTNKGDELLVWKGEPNHAFFYLPAGPAPTFVPAPDSAFTDFCLSYPVSQIFQDLDLLNIAGLTLANLKNLRVYSPDRPGGAINPFKFENINSWLHVGSLGLDGDIKVYRWNDGEYLGEPARFGYVGHKAFEAMLVLPDDKQPIFFQFASSAVFDSEINGYVNLPKPVSLDNLIFSDLETSSTAHLVGGDLILHVSGDTLDYWKLALEPTGDPEQAGVLSVRTGRLVFTAAGISEKVHFKEPFGLTWGEFYADGNIGRLFFDYNSYGQRFDENPYSAENIKLSKYVPGSKDGYLATCGTVHFNFFGSAFINIQDARYDASAAAPYFKRFVSVPQSGEAGCKTTDLHLQANWNNSRATFDFPNATMKYNETIQEGFIGNGKGTLSMIASDGLDAFIEIHKEAIDVRLSSANTVDLDFGLFARLGGMGQLAGCMRIEGPQLKKISIWGYLEQSVATGMGILAPKAGYVVTTNMTITPNSTVVMASGDMMFSLAASAVDVSGYVRLTADHAKSSIDGEIKGNINCNSIVGGLEGSGQLTWYLDPISQHLQGRMKISVCSWGGGAGLEGGLFIGRNVPKSKAWVLETGNKRFGVSKAILPNMLTGVYGYGQVSFNVNYYVFGGGVQIYAGMGAFTETPPGLEGAWTVTGVGLPYVIGSAGVHVHGEILGGLVSASAWGDLDLKGPVPIYFEGNFGLEGCVLWVVCASVDVTAGISPNDGFYIY